MEQVGSLESTQGDKVAPLGYRLRQLLRYWQTRTHSCGHIVADTNVSLFARARNICCRHKFCVRDTKMFLILVRNILCPLQMFPSLPNMRYIMSNNVSATMCPCLPVPLRFFRALQTSHVLYDSVVHAKA